MPIPTRSSRRLAWYATVAASLALAVPAPRATAQTANDAGDAAAAGQAVQQRFDSDDTAAIEAIIRDYLVENPEVLLDAMESLQAQQADRQAAAQSQAVAGMRDELLATPDGTALGNPDGEVTVVEFFDYNCGFCRQALADMGSLIEQNDDIRFVLKEIPVLGPESVAASRVSLAVRELAPERYGAFHRDLLASSGTADEQSALAVAADHGIDESQLRPVMDSTAVAAALDEANRFANRLRITGTPTYVIGEQVISGAVGLDELETAVVAARD